MKIHKKLKIFLGKCVEIEIHGVSGQSRDCLMPESFGENFQLADNAACPPHNCTRYSLNTQIHKYTDKQIHKYTNTKIHKYTNKQMHKYTTTQINKYTNTEEAVDL